MPHKRFQVNLYIIIPFIFGGIALLSMLVSYKTTAYYMEKGLDAGWPIAFWGMVSVLFALIVGILITRMFIVPLEKFVKKTESLELLNYIPDKDKDKDKATKDDFSRYTRVFDQVTELLSRVDARNMFPKIVGHSKAVRGALNRIIKVAPTDSTVLISGETGTGKELVARSIHNYSTRREKSFVAINCAAIPDSLIESELFGYEKGAFTGANAKKPGKFEIADNGTIFMDEIGDMPLETQAKLLRVLQEFCIERLGGIQSVKVNVRIIAATNQDLSAMVDEGKFRQDLFFRLNVFSIYIPPLRERKEDIPALVQNFADKLRENLDISAESMQMLIAYDWPGNVRELQNAVESASVLAKDVIEPVHLPATVTRGLASVLAGSVAGNDKPNLSKGISLDSRLHEMEKGIIIEALEQTGGIQTAAANLLGIKDRSLWHRIKKYGIDAAAFKMVGQ